MRRTLVTLALAALPTIAAAQSITLPPNGDNQKSSVSQNIGLVTVTIDYNSPDVHAPNGEDRRGKIYGTQIVHYGLQDLGFGTCKQCPWRAGSNENTVFTVSHDVKVEGQPLPAGRYGLMMIADPQEWTVIFSKNSTSWGSYFYDPAEDALRVKVKPAKNEYHEWLTYEFTDRKADRATVAMMWEELAVPFTITVENVKDLYVEQIARELRGRHMSDWRNFDAGARYALNAKHLDRALQWAERAASDSFPGNVNFTTLSTLADVQEAMNKPEAAATRERALSHPTASATDIHQYGRRLQIAGKKDLAWKAFELNAKKNPNVWPVNVGLARGHSMMGRYKEALKYAKLALAQAPDENNKRYLEGAIAKLEKGQDIN